MCGYPSYVITLLMNEYLFFKQKIALFKKKHIPL